MKKKILLMTAMVAVLMCVFAIFVSAAEPSYKDGEWIYAADGVTKITLRDTEGNPLIWYLSGEELKYVRADQTDETQSVYVKYNISASGSGFSGVSPEKTLKDIDIYENGVQIEGAGNTSAIVLFNMEKLDIDALNGWLWGSKHGCCPNMRGIYFPSSLKYIGQEGFTNTKLVQIWNMENTQLEYMNSCDFAATSTLTQEATNGVFQCPFTYGPPINLQRSKIKVYILNPVSEFNTCQKWYQFVRECSNLEKVIASSHYSIGFGEEAFRGTQNKYITFITGTEEDATNMRDNTQSAHNSGFKASIIISYDEYLKDQATYDNATNQAYIVYGYNYCDAFYKGTHQEDNNPCMVNCERCNTYGVAEKNPIHTLTATITYTSYDKAGEKKVHCTNDGCQYSDTEEASALFVSLGYSKPVNGNGSFTVGYQINSKAMNEYSTLTGKTFKYGLFVASQSKLGNNEAIDENGTAAQGVISADMTKIQHTVFELKIRGFVTDEQKAVKLALGAYVIETDSEGTSVSYLQIGTPLNGDKYYFTSYNEMMN